MGLAIPLMAAGVPEPVVAGTHVSHQIKPVMPVGIAKKNGFAPVATRGDVVLPAGEFDSFSNL
jgi:hypothetical protein